MTKFQTVLLAIVCFVLAGLAYKFIPGYELAAAGLGGIGMWLFGLAQQHPADKAKLEAPAPRDPQAGHATTATIVITYAIAFMFMVVSFAFAGQARADEAVPAAKWKHTLTLGVVATMIDFKTGAITLGAPVGSCYGATYIPWDAGLAGCLYAAAATDKTPNMAIASVQGTYRGSIGLGIGVLKLQGEPSVSAVGFVSGNVPLF